MDIGKPASFGELLQTLRKQKKIRQQPLADKLGVHRNTIGAWERGDRLPDSKGMVLELARVLHLDDQETRQLLEASLTALSPYWHVPYQRNPFFTGRHTFLETLHHRLRSEQSVVLSQSYALSGLGGIGKTQLALEYVYQHALDYDAIFWIGAETIETLYAGFATVAAQLQLPERTEKETEKVIQAVLRWLNTHKEWLLIFDNVASVALLKPFLPAARQGAILFTTQLRTLEDLSYIFELPPFPPDEGVQFLLRRAKIIDPIVSPDPLPPELAEPALAIVDAVGGLPLALDQAAAYIERTGCSLTDYLHLFQDHQISLLDERSKLAHHPASVVKTFLLSFERISQANEATADFLRLCAFLAPDTIPEEIFTKGAGYLGSALETMITDTYRFNEILGEALCYSLLGRQAQNHTLSMHRLVQSVLRDTLSEAEQRMWAERAIFAINTAFPEVEHSTWPQCERLLPHVLVCMTWIEHEPIQLLEAAHVFSKAGIYLRERGQYLEAEPLLVKALAIRERHLGAEHLDTATSLNNLAILYQLQGKYEQAEPLHQRAIMIHEQQLGVEHPETTKSISNLAILYRLQGKYDQAALLYQRTLAIREQYLGTDHPDTAKSLNNLAIIYEQQGKYDQAEPLYQRALVIRKQQLGTEHPDTAMSLNDLAELYRLQGKYEQAEPLYKSALVIWEQQLGPQHPYTAICRNNLAELYYEQGKYDEAEPIFQQVLSLFEQQLGSQHPYNALSLHGLAKLYQQQGKYEQSEAFYQRALTIRQQRLGLDHPEAQETRKAYAALLRIIGRDAEATAIESGQEPSIEGAN